MPATDRYLSRYDPRAKQSTPRTSKVIASNYHSALNAAEDSFREHRVCGQGVRVPLPSDFTTGEHYQICTVFIAAFCRQHRIAVLNHGMVRGHAILVNFVGKAAAAKFMMLWSGWGDENGQAHCVERLTHGFWGGSVWTPIFISFDGKEAERMRLGYAKRMGANRVRLVHQSLTSDPPEPHG